MDQVTRDHSESQSPRQNDRPRHWVDLEELEDGYWQNEEKQKLRAQEFLHKPIETLEKIEQDDVSGVRRRDFLTLMGASMAMASMSCVRRPMSKVVPYVDQPLEVTPGVPTYYASTCGECSKGCGILVKNRESRPIKLEGNPDHPLNEGKLCARGQASLLNLYDTDRLRTPVQVEAGSRRTKVTSWEELDSAVGQALKSAPRGSVRFLGRPTGSPSTNRVIDEFIKAQGGQSLSYEPLGRYDVVDGQNVSYGTEGIPTYRFDRAQFVLSLGSDFLGTDPSSVEHARDWSKSRSLDDRTHFQAKVSKVVTFESGFTVTGANSDHRYPIRPGDEVKVAMAIVKELKDRSRVQVSSSYSSYFDAYSPAKVASEIGGAVTEAAIKKVANELWESRGESIVIAGSAETQTESALHLQIVVNLLNSLLRNEGVTIYANDATYSQASRFVKLEELVTDMNAGKVDVLFLHSTNPSYYLPKELGFDEALKKVKTVIAINDRADETASQANWIASEHHYLENWGDASPRKGLFSLRQPAIRPIYETRSLEDSLIAWARASGKSTGLLSRVSGDTSQGWLDYLKSHWRERYAPTYAEGRSFTKFWQDSLQKGLTGGIRKSGTARSFRMSALSNLSKIPSRSDSTSLALYQKVSIGDGRSANNAWLQEMPDPITQSTWDNHLNMGVAAAKNAGLRNFDVVEVATADGKSVSLPVLIQPGLHPNTVTAAVGYGQKMVGEVGKTAGWNTYALSRFDKDTKRVVLSGIPVSISKTGRRFEVAITQGHHKTEGRPLVNDITIGEYRKNPSTANHTDPELRMKKLFSIWPEHKWSKDYRWGMALDLTKCTGCGSCVVACQAENNIPVVGRENVRVSREMHWIRIDRYYSGSEEHPDVIFTPTMCQHCENAPCETVCPVLATVHGEEGLNEMAYNRCVGTRYCQNNCPYKVRRFNFFDHWKDYKGAKNLVWNPSVTVRSRGIMEKCTFCVQRIQEARQVAKTEGRKIQEGDFQAACQQTCPTGAIAFGNTLDKKSQVSQWSSEARSYRLLELINTRPQVAYLSKVRNKEKGAQDGHSS